MTKIMSLTIMNLVTIKVGPKHESFFKKPDRPQRGVCWTSKSDLSSTTKYDRNHIFDNCEFGNTYLVGSKHELFFNKPASEVGLLNIWVGLK